MRRAVRHLADISDVTRDSAREAARQELSDPAYADARPSLIERAFNAVVEALERIFDAPDIGIGSPRVAALVLVGLLALLTVVILLRVGPVSRDRQHRALFAGTAVLTADGHREAAEQAAAQGRWADAVRERLRAVVRELESRGVLDARPGRTAGEVARDAGAAVPGIAAEMRQAATVFDEIWYGGREAGSASYDVLVDVDRRVTAARLVAS